MLYCTNIAYNFQTIPHGLAYGYLSPAQIAQNGFAVALLNFRYTKEVQIEFNTKSLQYLVVQWQVPKVFMLSRFIGGNKSFSAFTTEVVAWKWHSIQIHLVQKYSL